MRQIAEGDKTDLRYVFFVRFFYGFFMTFLLYQVHYALGAVSRDLVLKVQ